MISFTGIGFYNNANLNNLDFQAPNSESSSSASIPNSPFLPISNSLEQKIENSVPASRAGTENITKCQIKAFKSFIKEYNMLIPPFEGYLHAENPKRSYQNVLFFKSISQFFPKLPLRSVFENLSEMHVGLEGASSEKLRRLYEDHLNPLISLDPFSESTVDLIIKEIQLESTPCNIRRKLFMINNDLIRSGLPGIYPKENQYTPLYLMSNRITVIRRTRPEFQQVVPSSERKRPFSNNSSDNTTEPSSKKSSPALTEEDDAWVNYLWSLEDSALEASRLKEEDDVWVDYLWNNIEKLENR